VTLCHTEAECHRDRPVGKSQAAGIAAGIARAADEGMVTMVRTRRSMSDPVAVALLTAAVWLAALPVTTTWAGETALPPDTVARKVRTLLKEDPALARRHLRVHATGLVLTVSGSVGDENEHRRVLDIARAQANAHMIVDDTLSVLTTPVPAAQSRAAQYRFIRNAAPPPPPARPAPPAAPPRPPAPPPPRPPPARPR
jgi:hypothetical protein